MTILTKLLFIIIGAVIGILLWIGFGAIKENIEEERFAKIYFTGEVTEYSANELISTINMINSEHQDLEKIYLYIHSWGGDADAGEATYWMIRSSRIPITTVNLANVGSAASFMFCGGKERLSMDYGTFLLHPPAQPVPRLSWTPDLLRQTEELLRTYANFGTEIYKTCTSIPEEEIKAILYSENQRLVLSTPQAKERGLISGTVSEVIDTPLSYLVSN